MAYASLPSSPAAPSTPVEEKQPPTPPVAEIPFSLWDYLREEILATDFDSHQEMKWERVSNFLQVPYAIEKVRALLLVRVPLTRADNIIWVTFVFGLVPVYIHHHASASCPFALPFDHEHGATKVRIHSTHAPLLLTMYSFRSGHMAPAAKADILRMILLASAIGILLPITDASKIYHTIRGQDTIKLYVIFNSLEVCSRVCSRLLAHSQIQQIADRLCIAIGQDILDCLFSRPTLVSLSRQFAFSLEYARPVGYMILAVIYTGERKVLHPDDTVY